MNISVEQKAKENLKFIEYADQHEAHGNEPQVVTARPSGEPRLELIQIGQQNAEKEPVDPELGGDHVGVDIERASRPSPARLPSTLTGYCQNRNPN